MARLTWDQVRSEDFSGANEAARMATNLLSTASQPLISGIDSFQEAIGQSQSGQLMQRVNAQQDPAAAAAALADGSIYAGLDPRYLSAGSQEFAAQQAQRLLTEDATAADIVNTNARTGLVGVQTETGRYNLDRAQTLAGRVDAQYEARQAVNPLLFDIAELARADRGDEARALIAANEAQLAAAGLTADGLYASISTNVTGGQTEEEATIKFDEFLRTTKNAQDTRSIIQAAAGQFNTQAAAEAAIRDAVAQGKMDADIADEVIKGLEGLWQPLSPEAQALADAGVVVPGPQRGNTDTGWLPPDEMTLQRRAAIQSIESAGSGGYSAIGPASPTLGRPLGAYQIMEANVGPWSREVLGREVTVEEFMANPDIQDAIFDAKFGQYVQQYGEAGAAQAWFSGPGGVGDDSRADVLGTTNGEYAARYTAALGFGPGVPSVADAGRQPGASADAAAVSALLSDPNRPNLSFGSSDPTAAAARAAVENVTGDQAALDAGQGPRLARGDAEAVSAALREATAPQSGVMSPTDQMLLDRGIVAAQETATSDEARRQTILATPARDVPVGTLTNNPREALLDADFAARQAAETTENDIEVNEAEAAHLRERAAVTEVDLARSQAMQDIQGFMQNGDILGGIESIKTRLATGQGDLLGTSPLSRFVGGVSDYFGATTEEAAANAAERDQNGEAFDWYDSPAAWQYFKENTSALGDAAVDPVNFALERIAEEASAVTGALNGEGQAPGDIQQAPAEDAIDITAPISTLEMQRAIDNAEITGTLDNTNNRLGAMDAALENLPDVNDAPTIAAALVADGALFEGRNQGEIARLLQAVASDVGVDYRTAAGLLAQVIPETDDWDWTAAVGLVDGLPDYDLDAMKAVWEVYQQDTTLPDGTVVTGEQAGVNRLRSVRERERVTQELAQVQALFDAAKTEMQRAQAADPANRAAIQRAYEENVFPALRAQIAMIEGSGLLELYGSSDTGQ
jgi:hypothetical protein